MGAKAMTARPGAARPRGLVTTHLFATTDRAAELRRASGRPLSRGDRLGSLIGPSQRAPESVGFRLVCARCGCRLSSMRCRRGDVTPRRAGAGRSWRPDDALRPPLGDESSDQVRQAGQGFFCVLDHRASSNAARPPPWGLAGLLLLWKVTRGSRRRCPDFVAPVAGRRDGRIRPGVLGGSPRGANTRPCLIVHFTFGAIDRVHAAADGLRHGRDGLARREPRADLAMLRRPELRVMAAGESNSVLGRFGHFCSMGVVVGPRYRRLGPAQPLGNRTEAQGFVISEFGDLLGDDDIRGGRPDEQGPPGGRGARGSDPSRDWAEPAMLEATFAVSQDVPRTLAIASRLNPLASSAATRRASARGREIVSSRISTLSANVQPR